MGPIAESIWRELYTRAAPFSRAPYLSVKSLAVATFTVDDVVNALGELLKSGVIAPLTDAELVAVARGGGTAGNIVVLEHAANSFAHLRILDPHDVKRSISARIEILRRQLAELLEGQVLINRQLAGEFAPPGWGNKGDANECHCLKP